MSPELPLSIPVLIELDNNYSTESAGLRLCGGRKWACLAAVEEYHWIYWLTRKKGWAVWGEQHGEKQAR